MSTVSRPAGPFAPIVGPDTAAEATEQLAQWSEQLATAALGADDHVEQLADAARPTKPGQADAHAYDPSKTTTVQRRYAQRLRGRFDAIIAEINRGVRDRDVFELADADGDDISASELLSGRDLEQFVELLATGRYGAARDPVEQLADFDADDLVPRDYEFGRVAGQHEEFMRWLRGQQEAGVLEVVERDENRYVRKAYERGWQNATSWVDANPIDEDIVVALNRPVHEDRLQLLFERNYEALRGITDDVSREISRELANGLAEGAGPDEMARRLVDRIESIGKTRATTLARTEVMYSHNEAALTTYERLLEDEDLDVEIVAEVSTAGDDHVCDQCSPWNGETMPIGKARSDGPPFHPRCRCIVLPTRRRNEQAIERIHAQTQAAAA